MFKSMKIGTRLGLGFALVLVLLAAVVAISLTRLSGLNAGITDVLTDKYPKTVLSNEIIRAVDEIAQAMATSLVVRDAQGRAEQKAAIEQARARIGASLEALDAKVVLARGKELLAGIRASRATYVEAQKRFLGMLEAGQEDQARDFYLQEVGKLQDGYIASVAALVTFQDEMMEQGGQQAAAAYHAAYRLLLVIAALALVASLAIGFVVTRSITKPIGEAVDAATRLAGGDLTVQVRATRADETGKLLEAMAAMIAKLSQIIGEVRAASDNLSSASEQVSATAQTLSQGASEQAASVEETSASVEQMTASIAQNTENARITDGMAGQAASEAAEGGEAVGRTVSAMKSIAGKIGIIDDIAYQTNLLALNAAIEAARAGEHGKGFAVVAAEVRKLAERSQVAAQEIGELASGSVQLAERAGDLLNTMVPSIRRTSDLVQEIAAASAEQSGGVGQINAAMSQLSLATQQNASASEELAATAEEMSSQAEQLQGLMDFFRVEHALQRGAGPAPAAARARRPAARGTPAVLAGDAEFVRF